MREMEYNEAWLMRLICSLCSTSHDTRHWPSHAWDVSLITRTLMTQMPHIWGPVSRHCCRCCDREVRWRVWHAEWRCTSIIIWSLQVATKGIFDYKVIFHHTIRYSRSADGAFHDRSTTPDALIFPILIKFGERGYLACQKHWSQS